MRELPEERDREQDRGAEIEVTARRDPPGHRRQRAGDRADQHAERAARLERRVHTEIEKGRAESEGAGGDPDREGQIHDARRRERGGEEQRLERLEPTVRERAPSRAVHQGIDMALDVLVQRQGSGGRQEGPHEQVGHADEVRRAAECREVSGERGGEDHEQDARLGERDEIAGHLGPVAGDRRSHDVDGGLDHRPST